MNTPDKQAIALHELWAELAKTDEPDQVAVWVRDQLEAGTLARPDKNWDVMLHCLEKHQFASIPYLHQAGWQLRDTPESWGRLVKTLSIGEWPHPELIAPDCMWRDAVHGGIGSLLMVNMFFHPHKPWAEHLRRLDGLDRGGDLAGKLSTDMGSLADMSQINELPYACLDHCADFMLARGWIEPGAVLEAARDKLHGEQFCQWFSGAVARQMDQAAQSAVKPGRACRL